jgi:hypothetical protein
MHGCTAHTDLIRNIAPGLPDARLFRIKLQEPFRRAPPRADRYSTWRIPEALRNGLAYGDLVVLILRYLEVHSFHRQMQYDQDLRAVIANLTLETPKDGSDSASVHACQVW